MSNNNEQTYSKSAKIVFSGEGDQTATFIITEEGEDMNVSCTFEPAITAETEQTTQMVLVSKFIDFLKQ